MSKFRNYVPKNKNDHKPKNKERPFAIVDDELNDSLLNPTDNNRYPL